MEKVCVVMSFILINSYKIRLKYDINNWLSIF